VFCKHCQVSFKRKDIDFHEDWCVYRPVSCVCCDTSVLFKDIQSHTIVCPLCPVFCTFECGLRVPRNQLDCHQNQCPEGTVDCSYSGFGCNIKSKRRLISDHEEGNALMHTKLMAAFILKQNENILQLQQQVLVLRQQLLLGWFTYTIDDFSNVKANLQSPKTSTFGYKWYLCVNPLFENKFVSIYLYCILDVAV